MAYREDQALERELDRMRARALSAEADLEDTRRMQGRQWGFVAASVFLSALTGAAGYGLGQRAQVEVLTHTDSLLPAVSVYRDRARWSATPEGGGPECVLEIEYDSRRGGRAPERRSRLRLECSNEVVFSSDTAVLGELHEGGCVVEVWGERAEYFCVQRVQYARDDRQAIGLHLDTSSRSLRLEREGESVRYWLQLLEPGSAPNVAPPVVSVERARQELSCSAEVLSRTGARIGGFQARPGEACDVRLRFQGAQQQSTEACWLHVRCGEGRDLPVYGDGRGICHINDDGSIAYFVDSEGSTGDGDPVVVFSQTMDRMVIVDRAGDMPSSLHLATECDGYPILSAFGETSTLCSDPYPALQALVDEARPHGSSDAPLSIRTPVNRRTAAASWAL